MLRMVPESLQGQRCLRCFPEGSARSWAACAHVQEQTVFCSPQSVAAHTPSDMLPACLGGASPRQEAARGSVPSDSGQRAGWSGSSGHTSRGAVPVGPSGGARRRRRRVDLCSVADVQETCSVSQGRGRAH